MKKVAIVVVTYNRLSFLKDLIDSLRAQDYKDSDIIVINNSSTDGTLEYLELQNDLIVITQENCGGAGGFFTGLKYAAEHNYEYAWIMDDDVLVKKESLSKLMDKTRDCNGFLCSKVIDSAGNPCNVPGIYMGKQANGEVEWNKKIEDKLIKLSVASFVSVLIPVPIIKEIGLPYKEFFIWNDDIEYTKRISSKYESYMVGDSIVEHRRIQNGILSIVTETNKRRINMFFYFYRNYLFYAKSCSKREYLICILRMERDFLKCLFRLNMRKCFIIIKAQLASLFFKPKIYFPTEQF